MKPTAPASLSVSYRHDPELGYRFAPNVSATVAHEAGGYRISTNAQGFRSRHDAASPKPAGVFRVLLFGDSFVAGDGVDNDERFGDAVEDRIPGLQILNFGLGGTGVDQQFLIFRRWAAHLDHDLVVVAPVVDTIRRTRCRFRALLGQTRKVRGVMAKPYFTVRRGVLTLHHVPVPPRIFKLDELTPEDVAHLYLGPVASDAHEQGEPIPDLPPLPTTGLLPYYASPTDPAWVLMSTILRRWREAMPGPMVLCPIPTHHHVEERLSPEPYRARMAELEVEGIEVFDPLPHFHDEAPESRRSFRFDTDIHLTPRGHVVLADALASYLEPIVAARL